MVDKDFTISGKIISKTDSSPFKENWLWTCLLKMKTEREIPVVFEGSNDIETLKAIPIDQEVYIDVVLRGWKYNDKNGKVKNGVTLCGIGIFYKNNG